MESLVKISNKIEYVLGSPGQKTTQKHPKMKVSAGTKTYPISLKADRYVYHLNNFHLLKTE